MEKRKSDAHKDQSENIKKLKKVFVENRGLAHLEKATQNQILEYAIDFALGADYTFPSAVWGGSLYAIYTFCGMEQNIVHHPSWILFILDNVIQPYLRPPTANNNNNNNNTFVPMPPNYNHNTFRNQVLVGDPEANKYFRVHIESFEPLLAYMQPGKILEHSKERLTRAGIPFIMRGRTSEFTIAEQLQQLIGTARHKTGYKIILEVLIREMMKIPFNINQVALDNQVPPASVTRAMWMGISRRMDYALAVPFVQPFLRHVYGVKVGPGPMRIVALRVDYADQSPELSVLYKGAQVQPPAVFQLSQLPTILVMINDTLQELNDMRNWSIREPLTANCLRVSGMVVSELMGANTEAILLLGANFYVLDIYYQTIFLEDQNAWAMFQKEIVDILTPECAVIYNTSFDSLNGGIMIDAPFNLEGKQNNATRGRSTWYSTYTLPTRKDRFFNIIPHTFSPAHIPSSIQPVHIPPPSYPVQPQRNDPLFFSTSSLSNSVPSSPRELVDSVDVPQRPQYNTPTLSLNEFDFLQIDGTIIDDMDPKYQSQYRISEQK